MTPEPVSSADVRAKLERLLSFRLFRGPKLRTLLTLLVEEWIADRGAKLSEPFIGQFMGEPLTYERYSDKYGYPKTRANLGHVRNRLRTFNETEGYRDPVIIKLNPGSYVPVIAANVSVTGMPDLNPAVERLILRMKTAIDARTFRGAMRALHYYNSMPLSDGHPRHSANMLFIPMAAAAVIPSTAPAMRPLVELVRTRVRTSGLEPWEWTFAEGCCEACYNHNWRKALDLCEIAIVNSQEEAMYHWWYTALLACDGRVAAR